MSIYESMEKKKIDRIKELLEIPPQDRTEKQLIVLMNFTKVNLNHI